MPHATASWLVEHSSLSFHQIAEFCGLHILEVQAIADDTAATKLTGRDPIRSGELTLEEIERGQADPAYRLVMHREPDKTMRTRGPRYTPVSKRQDKPDGVAWLIRNHPELSDAQIGKLIGTTRSTIQAIRERSHWNIANIQPKDPVTLGLTSQRELDAAVAKAAKAAGAPPPPDHSYDRESVAQIEQLRAEREAAAIEAERLRAAEAEAEAAAADAAADAAVAEAAVEPAEPAEPDAEVRSPSE
ncbi:MAG: cell cycle transcriptional regulator TrcR [Sphingosinicella sp.]